MREHSRLAARNLRLAIAQPHASRTDARARSAQIVSRIGKRPCVLPSNGAGAPSNAISDVTPTIREFSCAPRTAVRALPGRQPRQRHRADRRTAGAALLFAGRRTAIQHLSHRGAAGAGQPRRLARACGRCSRARGSRLQIRRPCSKSTGRRKNYCLIAGGIGITPIIRHRRRPAPPERRRCPALRRQIARRCRLPRRTIGAARRSADRARLRRRRAARSRRHLPRSA